MSRNTRWMTSGHHVLEVVASCLRVMLGSVLSVLTHALAGLKWPTQCSCVSLPKESKHVLVHVFLCRTRAAKIFKGFLLRLGNGCVHNLVHRTIQCAAPRRTLGIVSSVKPSRASVANTMRTRFLLMNILLVKFHTLFPPELMERPLVLDDLPATLPAISSERGPPM